MDYKTAYERLYREQALLMDACEQAFARLKRVHTELEALYVAAPPAPVRLAGANRSTKRPAAPAQGANAEKE